MAAPIDTKFLFRENEFQDIDDAYLKVDVVILSGSAGTGKTRLALHYVKNHLDTKNEKIYCIHSLSLIHIWAILSCSDSYFIPPDLF